MKLTWLSNAPWAGTGYGNQTALFVPRIAVDGHEIAIAANYGLEAAATQWRGIPIFPRGVASHSEDIALGHHEAWAAGQPGWLLTLYDVWPLLPMPGHAEANIASWTPVDHSPVPPQVLDWTRQHYTIAMSKFGQRAFAEAGIDARYVPHGIDTAIFRPTPSKVREAQQIPADAFVVMINAANKGGTPVRKAWSEMLSAFALFSASHPDAYLYVHTNVGGLGGAAPRLDLMMGALGLNVDRVRLVSQYEYAAGRIPDTILAQLYSAADVLLATSMGEGFGIPVVEAQACGLPVIVTDFSAQSELCGAGWKVGYQPWFDHFQASFLATPLIAEILRGLEAAYEARGDQSLRAKAVEFAAAYDADRVYSEHFRPVLAELEQMLKPSRQVRRAKARKAA